MNKFSFPGNWFDGDYFVLIHGIRDLCQFPNIQNVFIPVCSWNRGFKSLCTARTGAINVHGQLEQAL